MLRSSEIDHSPFLSIKVPFLGLCYKMLEGNRKNNRNDFLDLSIFDLLPYVQVFVTENNNAEIIKKIRSLGLLDNLEVIRVSHKLVTPFPPEQALAIN